VITLVDREDAEFFWDERPFYLGGDFYSMPDTTEEWSALLWWEIMMAGTISVGAHYLGGSGLGILGFVNTAGGQLLFGYPAGAEVAVTTAHGTQHWAVKGSPYTLAQRLGPSVRTLGSFGLRSVPWIAAFFGASYVFDALLGMADPHVQDWFGSNQGERRGDPRGSQA